MMLSATVLSSCSLDTETKTKLNGSSLSLNLSSISLPSAVMASKAFASVGANAPEEVKQAWMDAAKEIGMNGLGMSGNGMLTHLSQMMVQRAENWMNGIGETNDILGSTVQSAIRATEQALYDLDHPLSPDSVKSIEVQRQQVKERAFYQLFLDKLGALV